MSHEVPGTLNSDGKTRQWITRTLGVALLVLAIVPAVLWGNPYPSSALMYWGVGGLMVVALSLLVRLVPAHFNLVKPSARVGVFSDSSPTAYSLFTAIVGTCAAAWMARNVFGSRASTTDEVAQLWHARILLTGRWALPVDPDRAFFALDTVVDGERWYSQFPIGGPLLLAPGMLIGAPWIINTLLTGASAASVYWFARSVYGEKVARVAALLMATAPSIVIMGGTMMNHVPVLFLWTAVLWLLPRWEAQVSARRRHLTAFFIGLSLGLMATIRPLDAVAAALATGLFQLTRFKLNISRSVEWVSQSIGGLLGVAVLFIAQSATTGAALRFAYDVQWGAGHSIGFHMDPYGRAFTLQRGIEQALTYLGEIAMFVMAWPVPSIVLVSVSLLLVRRPTRWDFLLLSHFLVQLGLHVMYWGRGEFLGPRFLFTALPTLIVFIARLPIELSERVSPGWRPAVPMAFAAMMAISWLAPASTLGVRGLMRIAGQSRVALRVDVEGAVKAASIDSAVVFLREPFSARLTRRLWGLGLRRDETAQLLAAHDACAVHAVVAQFEAAPSQPVSAVRGVLAATPRIVASDTAMASSDGVLALNGPGSLDPACRTEFDADTTGGFVAFGVGLPLEPIDPTGHVAGPIVYAADLGPANSRLIPRFGDRPWYVAVNRGRGVSLERIPTPNPTRYPQTPPPQTPN
ncbi:MAG: hypothetical protein K2R93_08770 [Gemmatimonadaceae bacterium]|nr:hypothetical protein [Gemmatimonadaceae bacterium]